MSLLDSTKGEVIRISNDIKKKQTVVEGQIRELEKINSQIEAVMSGTSSSAYSNVINLLCDAAGKSKKAQAMLIETSNKLSDWAANS